jgi:Lhr-like helicase
MTEMLKLSEEVHKEIIRESLKDIDEKKVKKIAKERPDANPFRYQSFCVNARSVGYNEEETDEKYKEIADKILASSCPILTCFEELVLFFDLFVAGRAAEGCIHHHHRILDGDDDY